MVRGSWSGSEPSGEWLVVMKRYGGLHAKWSFPAGFVSRDETIDQAILREVKEETGVACTIASK